MAEVSKTTTKTTEGTVTRGETVRTYNDGTQHVTTFVSDSQSGLGLRASYDVNAQGIPSNAHFQGQNNTKSSTSTPPKSEPQTPTKKS